MRGWLVSVPLIALVLGGAVALAHEGHTKEHNHPYPKRDFSLRRGAALYRQYCAQCHGRNGYNPDPPAYMDPRPSNFLDRQYMVMKSRIDLFEAARDGRPGTRMRPWADRLSEDELWDVVSWIEHLFTHEAHKR